MKITCPKCGFAKDVDKARLASAKVLATCPKCGNSFRIYKEDGRTESINKKAFAQGGPDDPLPPGAIIPEHSAPSKAPENASTDNDEDELRKNAMDAYKRQSEMPEARSEAEEDDFAIGNPWEHSEGNGIWGDFCQTCLRIMFAAPRFFSGISPESSRPKAFYFFIIITVVQILVERLWGGVLMSIFNPGETSDPQLHRLLQMLAPDSSISLILISRTASSTLQLFFDAAIFHVAFRVIIGKKSDFYLIFLVLAYSSAPALLCLVPLIGSIAGFIWAAACGFVGCRYALRISWGQTAMAMVPIYVVGIFTVLYLGKILQATVN